MGLFSHDEHHMTPQEENDLSPADLIKLGQFMEKNK
jgi:hypothetical protein